MGSGRASCLLSGKKQDRPPPPLRRAQRVWIAFRHPEARFAGSATADGSLSGVVYLTEMADLTEEHIKMLKAAGN